MSQRSVLNSPGLLELKKKRRRVLQNKILSILLAIIVILGFLVYLSRLVILNISSIEVTGNKITDSQSVKSVIENQIEGYYLWFFPKTNILFYPKNEIEKVLQVKFRRLKGIELSIKEKKILEVSVTERSAAYTWCGLNSPDIIPTLNENDQKCYFMDKDGYIFDQAAYFSGDVYFKFYGQTQLVNDAPTGQNFLPASFQKLIFFKTTLENMQLKPVALYVDADGTVKMFLSGGVPATAPAIIFKVDSDFQKIAENLEAALSTEPLQSDFKKKYSSLLYIDLRYGNKVYYKFR